MITFARRALRPCLLLSLSLAAAACAPVRSSDASRAEVSEWRVPASRPASAIADYRIGSLDKLNVTVFQVEDLTLQEVQVDASGNLQLPLIGTLQVRGLTTAELAEQITERLAATVLQNPQVSVTVTEAASQKVTVDGAVTEPGVFQMRGNTTLIQAVAMAKGPSRVAALDRVAVFRTVNGQRMVAQYDLRAIRRGEAADPPILGDDVIVVDTSGFSVALREVFGALPGLAIFRPY